MGHLSKLSVLNVVNNRLKHLPVTILLLDKIKAIWLSATQSKPLVPLQREHYGDEVVLTCVLLPQIDCKIFIYLTTKKSILFYF